MLDVYVINLATSTERWETTSNRLTELEISYERFEAVDGRKEPHPLFTRYDDSQREKYRRKPLSGGELGCFASHFLLWKKCVELNKPIVVLEDDLIINESLNEALQIAAEQISTLQYLRLAATYPKPKTFKKIKSLGQFDLIDHIRGPSGTLGYVISPDASAALIEHAEKWFIAVDDYMDRYWWHGVDCYSLMPFPIIVAENDSDIVRVKKEPQSLWLKLRKEVYGLVEKLKLYKYRMRKS
ncbi:MAG: glycosyl transferase family 25 [Oleiphilaceae bacterium]|jgi:glycosyl transferase family 25